MGALADRERERERDTLERETVDREIVGERESDATRVIVGMVLFVVALGLGVSVFVAMMRLRLTLRHPAKRSLLRGERARLFNGQVGEQDSYLSLSLSLIYILFIHHIVF